MVSRCWRFLPVSASTATTVITSWPRCAWCKYVKKREHFYIAMDELNDVEVGKILASCELTIGTRLHSVIIMMNSSIYVRMCLGSLWRSRIHQLSLAIVKTVNEKKQTAVAIERSISMLSTLNVSILNDCAAEPGNPMNYRIPSRVHPDLNQYYDKTEWIQYF